MIGRSSRLPLRRVPLAGDDTKQSELSAFISHAKADEKKAGAIAKALEAKGFKCWIAPRDVKPGRSYGDEIIRGIESARSSVLVLSKASNDSAFVAREVERAVSKKKPIFAVRVADVQPGPALELFISARSGSTPSPVGSPAHVDRLATMLAEEEGRTSDMAPPSDTRPVPRNLPKWVMPLGLAAMVLLVVGTGAATDAGSPFTAPIGRQKTLTGS
jgi:TIR domain